jgi:FAD/FMN-containing dehydrogenases
MLSIMVISVLVNFTLRPIINLKTKQGQKLFRVLATETATLVKKHRGSISGEHGDGRLRGEFIKMLYGEETYQLMREVKQCWDPDGMFNLHKIVDTTSHGFNVKI